MRPSRWIVSGVFIAHALLAASANAGPWQVAGSALTPLEVVEAQLDALQSNDTPVPDAGIARAWAFAHPDNKAMTGPLARFTKMLESPPYRHLIDHRGHEIESLASTEDQAVFAVTVTSRAGEIVVYQWVVTRVGDGPQRGAWLTSAVSAPLRAGKAI